MVKKGTKTPYKSFRINNCGFRNPNRHKKIVKYNHPYSDGQQSSTMISFENGEGGIQSSELLEISRSI